MDIAMWGKALRTIPRVDKPEWDRLDSVSRWLIATRAAVFVMTAFSCLVGAVLAWKDGALDPLRMALCFAGLVLAHATNNLVNDLTDSWTGVDKNNYFRTMYGPQPIEHGLWTVRHALFVTALTGLAAASCGVALVWLAGSSAASVLVVMGAGAFFVLFYTWPLKHIALGEPAVLAVWGPLMVGGTYLAVTGTWSWSAAAIGAVYAIGPTCVLFGKHTDKLVPDLAKRIHTLPVVLGEPLARACVIVMLVAQPLLVTALVMFGVVGPAMLVVWLGAPAIAHAVRVFAMPRPTERPADFPAQHWPTYLAGHAYRCNLRTGSLFVLGLVLDALIARL